ncbi:MAG: histidine kinase, partial [Brevundimonas sp.]|nr:histidine kinase [Brevundimonas sp.]NWE52851.1 histidine kinase [Brevundimonas sp. P7753]
MTMSRALDRAEPVLDAASAEGGVVVTAPNAAFFRQPLAPILTAVGVTILVVLAISFARTNGLVAALWGAGGLGAAVWL